MSIFPKSTSILKSNGKSIAISARKASRQRLRQVTRWDTSEVDTASDFLRQNPGMLDRSRYRTPSNKLEKIDLLGRLRKSEIESNAFKGSYIDSYPVIDSYNPDRKAFCQNMKNKLNAVDCANNRYPSRPQVANMAEAVNCICHFCGQQGHKKPDCPVLRADLEAKGLNVDEINDRIKQRRLNDGGGTWPWR